jgi:hypothetical protein
MEVYMKKQLFTIALLVSMTGTMGAMQLVKEYNGPIKAIFSSPGSIIATLPNGTQISLDPSVQWDVTNSILSRLQPRPTAQAIAAAAIATQTVVQTPTPKAQAIQPAPMVVAKMPVTYANGRAHMSRRAINAPVAKVTPAPITTPVATAPAPITAPVAAPKAPAVQAAPKARQPMVFVCHGGKCALRR